MTHLLLRLVSHLGLRGSSRRQFLEDYKRMGQASSSIRGNAGGKDEPRDKGLKGLDTDEAEVEQRAVADVLAKADDAEKVSEAAEVSMEKKIEKEELVPESKPAQVAESVKELVPESKPVESVKEEVRSQTALNLALAELGEPPERPLPGDCCGQGCDVCVWDTYNDELRDYLARKKALLKQSK